MFFGSVVLTEFEPLIALCIATYANWNLYAAIVALIGCNVFAILALTYQNEDSGVTQPKKRPAQKVSL